MFERRFWGDASLENLQEACKEVVRDKTADFISVEGRPATRPDGSPATINIASFDPKDDESEVKDDLTFIAKSDADVAFFGRMASEGKTQVGSHDGLSIYVGDSPVIILVFGKTTHPIFNIS